MTYKVFVAIKTELGKAEDVRKRLKTQPLVKTACTVYSGPYDVVLVIEVLGLEEYQKFALYTLPKISGIDDYESFIAIEA